MYESHFGFTGSPFQLNPDPAFYFDSRGHSNALAYLKFGAHQGEGFIVVTGEIGAGKTTLVRTLLEGLDPNQVVAAQVVSTQLESSELLQAILMAFGIPSSNTSKAHLIASLEAYLTTLAAKGRRALLIIDEAQNLRHEAVEELRMLSNFQLGKYGLLQSFLVGQPELRGLLQSKSMEQLRQRVIASCHLGPLDPPETRAYVEHRLKRVGWNGSLPSLSQEVLDRVHYWTGGVPRKINRLCNRLLLGAFLANARIVSAAMVDETALELRNEIGEAIASSTPASPVETAEPTPAPAQPSSSQAVAAPPPPPEPIAAPAPARLAPPTPSALAHEPSAVGTVAPVAPELSPPGIAAAAAVTSADASGKGSGASAVTTSVGSSVAAARGVDASPDEPATPITWQAHDPARMPHPILCLVGSVADYLKAGLLARVFRSFPSLPQVVAVHAGAASDLVITDFELLGLPLPSGALHLGVAPASFARSTARVLEAFDAVLSETAPQAVMIMGSTDTDLACALLSHKRGVRLLRTGSGNRDAATLRAGDANSVLIERIADVLYSDSTESFYTLYREGIRLDRVHSVGSLSREAIDTALASLARADASVAPVGLADAGGGEYALVTVDPRTATDAASLVETLARWSLEMRLVWLMQPGAMQFLKSSDASSRLRQTTIQLVAEEGIRRGLAWVQGAACLVCGRDGSWHEEARLLGITARTLGSSLRAGVNGGPKLTGADDSAAPAPIGLRQWFVEASSTTPAPPEYWNVGTATRIAGQLINLLATAQAGSKSGEASSAIPVA